MPQSRKSQICLSATPYYHCVSRCVRRAYLCGEDKVTGKSYEHRRQWVENKMLFLTAVFAIEVCAYAIMSNHSHMVLFINQKEAESWNTYEILTRWHRIFKGSLLTQKYLQYESLTKAEIKTVENIALIYQKRLADISWFMRVLNEGIARKANQEDNCTGRFWEGRFKSQALLDEAALLTCMAYVDLNPVRANLAKTPRESNYTSVKQRIYHALNGEQPCQLKPFLTKEHQSMEALPFSLLDYFRLIDVTSQSIKVGNMGSVKTKATKILTHFKIEAEKWIIMIKQFETIFHGAVGNKSSLASFCAYQNQQRRSNLAANQLFFS